MKGKSIAIFSAKGGVGKTTTVLNLAGIYKLLKKKVLIIDLDLTAGGVAVSLNKEATKTIFNLVEDLNSNRYDKFEDYETIYDENICFLASPKDPRLAKQINSKFIDLIIDKATYKYDIVLIDTNHYLSDINLVALDKVDEILFLMTDQPADLKNTKSLVTIFDELEINKYDLVLNYSSNPFKSSFTVKEMENILGTNIKYQFSPKFFIKNIDEYVLEGKIITLEKKMPKVFPGDFTTLMDIATDVLEKEENKKVGDSNE